MVSARPVPLNTILLGIVLAATSSSVQATLEEHRKAVCEGVRYRLIGILIPAAANIPPIRVTILSRLPDLIP